MAEVWVARRALGRKGSKFVALKLIVDHYVGDERYTRMFRAEAELAALLSHANIVQVFDEGEEDGRSYLVMEWVDGLNLLKLGAVLALLDDEDRRHRVIAYIIGQLLYALGYAHSITSYDGSPLGVVHRDVSPQNVMISNHGEVKLTDFGVAYHVMEESSGIHVKGKVRYMSPEQLQGKTRSPTVDLYAVGALLHELLDGKKFRNEFDDGQEMFTAVLSGEIPPLSRSAPPELDELRLRLLEPDPAHRIQSAEEAIEYLRQFPDYGDARGELTKLCGGLTGIVRPRVGPGQSGQVPMADRRTTKFSGRKGLAKPQVAVTNRPGPPPSSVRSPAPPVAGVSGRTGSTTALKSVPRDPPLPVITGQTELVRPQQLFAIANERGGAQGFATPATVPLRSSGAIEVEVAAQRSEPIPVELGAQPSHPISVAAPSPSPPSSAEAMHEAPPSSSAIPYAVTEQASYRIPVQAQGGAGPRFVEPTERLGPSETSGQRPPPAATEVIDASMIIEVSGTDQDIFPVAAAREGTDTSRELAPQSQAHSISIVLPRRSAMAMIGVGLVLVAVMSMTITWWLFTQNRGDARVAAIDPALGTAAAASMAPEAERAAEAKDVEPEGEALPVPPAEPADAASEAVETEPPMEPPLELGSAEIGAVPEPEPSDALGEDAVSEGESAGEVGSDLAGGSVDEPTAEPELEPGPAAEPEPAPEPEEEPPPPEPQKAQKAVLVIKTLPGFEGAQVRAGSAVLTMPKGRKVTKKLSAGKIKLAWRRNESAKWRQAPSVKLHAGKATTFLLTGAGLNKI